MKTLTKLSLAALLLSPALLSPLPALAAPFPYAFRVTDNSGNLIPGATIAVGATTLTPGTPTVVPASAGEKTLNTNAAPAAAVTVTLLDFGTGDYALVYDTATQGEIYLPVTVSKAGSTFTGANALIAVTTPSDPNNIATAATNTGTLITGQTTITGQTVKIGTNAADSPNAVAAQGQAAATNTAVTGTGVKVAPGSIGFAQLTNAFASLLPRAYLISTGVTSPVTADVYHVAGLDPATSIAYYQGNATGLYAWFNGTAWVISSVEGTNGSAYFTGGPNVTSPFAAAGTATGTPVIAAHGNAILAAFQPDVSLPTDTSVQADTQAGLTAQGLTLTRSAKLDNVDVAVSTRSTFAAGGAVTASNLPNDYQQRGVPVSLPATAPTGYGGGSSLTAAQVRQEMDANSTQLGLVVSQTTPANQQAADTAALTLYAPATLTGQNTLLTQTSSAARQADMTSVLAGGVTLKTGEYANIAAAVLGQVIDGTVTLKQAQTLQVAYDFGLFTRTKTATTQTVVFSNRAGLPIATTVQPVDASGNPLGRSSVTFSNLP